MKISHKLCVRMGGTQFFYYDGLQPKMRAGMINEHECTYWSLKKDTKYEHIRKVPEQSSESMSIRCHS